MFTAALSEASGRDVTVDWATSVETGDNATSDTDFTAASGTLTFMPGRDDGDVRGADDRGHHRRGRRDLYGDAVERDERDAGDGPDGDRHDHRRRRAGGDDRGGPERRLRECRCRRLHAEPDRVDGGGAAGDGGGDAAGGPRPVAGRGGGGAHGDVRGGRRDGDAERGAGGRRSRRSVRQAHRGGAGRLGLHGGQPGLGHGGCVRYRRHRTAAAGEPDGVGGGGGRRGGAVLGRARAVPGIRPSPVPVQDGRELRRVDGYSEQWAKRQPWRGWFEPDRLHGDRPGGRAVAHLPGADAPLVE